MKLDNLFSASGEYYHIKDITSIDRINVSRYKDELAAPPFSLFRDPKNVPYNYHSSFKVYVQGRSVYVNSKYTKGHGATNYTENSDQELNDKRDDIILRWNNYNFKHDK